MNQEPKTKDSDLRARSLVWAMRELFDASQNRETGVFEFKMRDGVIYLNDKAEWINDLVPGTDDEFLLATLSRRYCDKAKKEKTA